MILSLPGDPGPGVKKRGRPRKRFPRHTEGIGRDVSLLLVNLDRDAASCASAPESSYRTQQEEHALPIVRDPFRPAIPQRVARQHCPPPLGRYRQNKLSTDSGKGIIIERETVS
jgi:hypothetical protein